jgi:hypothetical protein
MRWKASQLVMQIGFRHSPSFGVDYFEGLPATGLHFLEHHFVLEHPEKSDYDTTADVFSALSNVYPEDDMDLTKSFLSGMIASLQVEEPARLKPRIISFIHRFRRQIFEAMSENQKQIFFSTMSSEIDIEGGKDARRDILMDAIMSPAWRRYLGLEHLNLLESLLSTIGPGDDIFYVYQYTNLISALADENLLNGAILKTWLQIFWLPLHIVSDMEMTQEARSAIKELFIRRPELMDDFRTAINLQTQLEFYRNYPNGIQRGRDKLDEICIDLTSALPSTSLE